MCIKRSIQVSSAVLIVLVLCMLFSSTVQAASRGALLTPANAGAPTSVDADVYLTGQMLQPIFQSTINKSIPQMVSSVLSGMVNKLPPQDQAWALQMANALLQPSATLVSLQPEADGVMTTLKISLYQG